MPERETIIATVAVVVFLALLLGAGGALTFYAYQQSQEGVISAEDYDFTGRTWVDNEEITLSDYKGQTVLLEFMFLHEDTCDHCRETIHDTIQLLDKVRENYTEEEVFIIIINMAYDNGSGQQIEPYMESMNITHPLIVDPFKHDSNQREFNNTKIGSKYMEFLLTSFTGGGFDQPPLANPTFLIISPEFNIVRGHQLSSYDKDGYTDGDVVTDDQLMGELKEIKDGEASQKFQGEKTEFNPGTFGSFIFFFVVGIFIATTPCALTILVSLTTYVIGQSIKATEKEKEGELEAKESVGLEQMGGDDGPSAVSVLGESMRGLSVGGAIFAGIGLVFFILGCLLAAFGNLIPRTGIFFFIAGAILILVGINIIIPYKTIFLKIKKAMGKDDEGTSSVFADTFDKLRNIAMKVTQRQAHVGGFLLGILLALGWAPCLISMISPILLFVFVSGMQWYFGGIYMFILALGYCTPLLILSALAGTTKGLMASVLLSIGKYLTKAMGVLIILGGIFLIVIEVLGVELPLDALMFG